MATQFSVFTKFIAVDKMSAVLGKMHDRVSSMQKDMRRLQTGTGGVLKSMGGRHIERGLMVGAVAIGAVAKSAIDTASKFESIETAIRFVSGTAEEGSRNMMFLKKTVGDLKVEYEVTAESFKRFLGAMKATSIEADRQRDIFKKFATVTRVLGMTAEETERVFYAVGEMFSKGTIMSQELKLQLGNSLPGAVKHLANTVGVEVPELMNMMKKGMLNSEKYVGMFADYLYNDFKGGVTKATKTIQARITDMGNNWKMTMDTLGRAIASSGVLEMMGEAVLGVKAWLEANNELVKSKLKEYFIGFKNAISWIYENREAIISFSKKFIVTWGALKAINLAAGAFSGILGGIGLLLTPGGLILAGVGLLAASWWDVKAGADAALESYNKYKDTLDNPHKGKMSREEFNKQKENQKLSFFEKTNKASLMAMAMIATNSGAVGAQFSKENFAPTLAGYAKRESFPTYEAYEASYEKEKKSFDEDDSLLKNMRGQGLVNPLRTIYESKTNSTTSNTETNKVEVELTLPVGFGSKVSKNSGGIPIKVSNNLTNYTLAE